MDETAHDIRLKRLKFRAWHRGFVEADLILGPFVDTHAAGLTPDQLDRLEALLDESDHDIYGWIIGRKPTPPAFDTDVMDLIQGFRLLVHAARQDLDLKPRSFASWTSPASPRPRAAWSSPARPEGFDALVVADVARARRGVVVFVARDGARAAAFAECLAFFAPEIETLRIPSWDCLPYDRIGPSAGVAAARMAALSALATRPDGQDDPLVVVATVPALVQRVPPREAITAASYQARTGRDVDMAELERYFAVNGYVRASTVSERGRVRHPRRGDRRLPAGAEEPVRLDLFGDTLESIRAFDPETQRSTRQLKSVDLLPVSRGPAGPEAVSRFRTGYLALFGAAGRRPALRRHQRGRPAGRAGALAAAVLRADGDPVRLSSATGR